MRLVILFIIAAFMQVSAASFGQTLSLSERNISLKKVFWEIKKQTGYEVIYADRVLDDRAKVSVSFDHTPLKAVLESCLKDLPVDFVIEGNGIVIREKVVSKDVSQVEGKQGLIDVRGKVVDEKGAGLPGVTVRVKGGSQATVTDVKGEFLLKKVDERAVLSLSFMGYLTKEVNAGRDLGLISLEVSNSKLDEVQVIAYGQTSRRFSTSNIGTVGEAEIAKQPVANPILALSGRVPGLFIQQGSGVTASNVNVTIQGKNSLNSGTQPLYIIDGIPYPSSFTDVSLMGSAISGLGGNPFNFLNSSDIESISILKDADATSIYGSRAANGAILITTKKGKAGTTKVDVNMQSGFGKITKKVDLLNTTEYLDLRKEFYKNNGQEIPTIATTPDPSNYDLTVYDQNKYTDWQRVLIGGTAKYTDLQASISGGNSNTQFITAYGYHRETTVYPGNLADLKGNIHFSLNHNSTNNKFKYALTGSYLLNKNTLNSADLTSDAISLAPNAPSLYNSDGSLNWGTIPNSNNSSFVNPLRSSLQGVVGNTNNFLINNLISYEIINGLVLKFSSGYNTLDGTETRTTPISFFLPEDNNKTREASYLTKSIRTYNVEPQITYLKETNFGVFDLLLGGTYQQTNTDIFSQTGKGYSNDAQLTDVIAASSLKTDYFSKNLYKYAALFGRLNYRLNDKYILNLNLRQDGSSRFGDENKLHSFYSVGGAWLFGEEKIFKNSFPILSTGKLRVNYGTTGNDQIGDYNFLSLLNNYTTDIPYQGSVSLYPLSISNPLLQWEETRKLNIGLNLGFFKDRISLDVNYFRNRSSNQLLGYDLPSITGFVNVLRNFPATIQNKGIEVQLDAYIIKSKDFNWRTSINFTSPKNSLISFTDLANSSYANQYVIGESISLLKEFNLVGVNKTTGLYEFLDNQGNLTSNPDYTKDRTRFVNPDPKYYGGVSNTFSYKNFQVDFLFQFVKQIGFNNTLGNYPGFFYFFGNTNNQPTSILNRWQAVGDITQIQKTGLTDDVVGAYSAALNSTGIISDASFIRLKNASLSYSVPSLLLKRWGVDNLRFFAQGQNLLTFTKFKGDPETRAIGVLPPLKMLTLGLHLTL